MDATAVSLVGGLNSLVSLVTTSTMFAPSSASPNTQYTPLPNTLKQYFVRRDNGDRQNIVNVFTGDGLHIYRISRTSQLTTLWTMTEADTNKEVATICASIYSPSLNFVFKPGLRHRKLHMDGWLTGLVNRKFYLTDGASYQWNYSTQYLERVLNPGGGSEERRERVAHARLLRRFKFDYEVLVDAQMDREVVLASGFAAMLLWPLSAIDGAPGVRSALPPQTEQSERRAVGEIPPHLLVYEESPKKTDFFNPPGFMK